MMFTPINWIVIIWSTMTCITTVFLYTSMMKQKEYSDQMEKYTHIFSPFVVHMMLFIGIFVDSFLRWPYTLLYVSIWGWIRYQIVCVLVVLILLLTKKGMIKAIPVVMWFVKLIAPAKDEGEKIEKQ